jgi:PAS domain S-box-containing protein
MGNSSSPSLSHHATAHNFDFLPSGGQTGALIRSIDWSHHPLGLPDTWPSALRTMLGVILASRHPMFIWWGSELYQFYNDAYLPSLGIGKHPTAMGQRGEQCWPEVWSTIWPQIRDVLTEGKPSWNEDHPVPIFRNGNIEEVYWTYGYSPIYEENRQIGGVLVVGTETTEQVLTRRVIEERYRAITELSPQGVWISDEKGALNYTNFTFLNYMGVEMASTLGDQWIERLHPEDRDRAVETWKHSLATGLPYEIEFRVLSKDGSYGWFLNRALPIREKGSEQIVRWLGVSTDITARKHVEDDLKRTGSILNSIVNSSTDVIYVKDRESRMLYCNPITFKLAGTGAEQIYGKNDVEFLGPGHGGEEILHIDEKVIKTGLGTVSEEWVTWKDGTRRLYMSRKEPHRDLNGEVIGLIGISRDITELEQERELRERFVATLSHDLRTPLTAAQISVQMVERNPDTNPSNRKLAHRISDSLERLDNMIRDLLDANRIRAGEKLPIETEHLKIKQMAASTLEELSTVHGDRFRLEANTEIEGYWSKSGIRRIVENLCNNAIKYGSEHKTVQVEVTLIQEKGCVQLSVRNEGPVIPKEDQSRLFEPFKRSTSALTGGQRGWGLGLTLVKGIAEAHGGEVSVVSSEGTGTIFSVILPIDSRP